VYAIGTIPNIEIARIAKLDCRRGVIVNQHMQTSDPNIYALGEIAEFDNFLYGITSAAEQQADVAVRYLLGDLSSIYSGSVLMNILKFENLDLCSIGIVEYSEKDDTYEEVVFMDMNKRYYKRCIIKNDRLVGAVLMGDKNEFAEFKALIEDEIELADKRNEILRSNEPSVTVKGALVCSCSQVGVGNIEEAVMEGCTDLASVCKSTGAGLGCGSCKPEVRDIVSSTLQKNVVKI
jgi:ferredoxin-nitrate reductase